MELFHHTSSTVHTHTFHTVSLESPYAKCYIQHIHQEIFYVVYIKIAVYIVYACT